MRPDAPLVRSSFDPSNDSHTNRLRDRALLRTQPSFTYNALGERLLVGHPLGCPDGLVTHGVYGFHRPEEPVLLRLVFDVLFDQQAVGFGVDVFHGNLERVEELCFWELHFLEELQREVFEHDSVTTAAIISLILASSPGCEEGEDVFDEVHFSAGEVIPVLQVCREVDFLRGPEGRLRLLVPLPELRRVYDEHTGAQSSLLGGLLGRLGDLGRRTRLLLLHALDDTHSNSLLHVTHGKTTERRVLSESLHDHGLARLEDDHGGVTVLDGLGVLLERLTGTLVHTARDLVELARDVRSVAIDDRRVTGLDGTRVVQNDDLRGEGHGGLGGVVLGVRGDVTSADVGRGHVLHVETDVVTGAGNLNDFVVHFNGLALSGDRVGGEGQDHTGLELTSLHTTDGDGTNTTDLVHTLERKTQRLVDGPLRGLHHVEGLDQGLALVPRHVGGALHHVVAHETGDGHERHLLDVVADLLQVSLNFLLNFTVTVLLVVTLVHLVDGANDLLDTKSEGQKSVLTGLTFLRAASKPPASAGTTSIATSACEVPVIMFLMKSR
ncbi:translation elongation factor 1-alpha [Babesia caballi]|uniref:Translation elongation factor 1-alpha n=1 Tax=Babesia caballi TaxID=5871 RepID=A0AAV4LSB9_BABCB|nr:translation elongation factor 1-alpha [Babesia caballi]